MTHNKPSSSSSSNSISDSKVQRRSQCQRPTNSSASSLARSTVRSDKHHQLPYTAVSPPPAATSSSVFKPSYKSCASQTTQRDSTAASAVSSVICCLTEATEIPCRSIHDTYTQCILCHTRHLFVISTSTQCKDTQRCREHCATVSLLAVILVQHLCNINNCYVYEM